MAQGKPYERYAEVYDKIHGEENDFYERYYEFIVEVLERLDLEPDKVLEMACGTGNLTEILQEKGFEIEGLDLSEEMLEVARSKGLEVHQTDMSDFDLGKKYDLILCIYDSLNYLTEREELEECFDNAYEHLNSGGAFIFDMNSKYFIEEVAPERMAERHKVDGDIVFHLNSGEEGLWILRTVIFEKLEEDKYRRYEEKHEERGYGLEDVKGILKDTGFKVVGVYSSHEFEEVEDDTKRWFFVCRKK